MPRPSRPLAEGVVLGEVPRVAIVGDHERHEVGDEGLRRLHPAGRERFFHADVLEDLPANETEAEATVEEGRETTAGAEDELLRPVERTTGELRRAALRIDAADERLFVLSKAIDIRGIEPDVRIDPHELLEALRER